MKNEKHFKKLIKRDLILVNTLNEEFWGFLAEVKLNLNKLLKSSILAYHTPLSIGMDIKI